MYIRSNNNIILYIYTTIVYVWWGGVHESLRALQSLMNLSFKLVNIRNYKMSLKYCINATVVEILETGRRAHNIMYCFLFTNI